MVVITGGGTGGHLYPGLAAAQALQQAGQSVVYIGATGGIEERVLPQSGLPYHLIPAGKLSRDALRPAEGLKFLRGLTAAYGLLRQLKPQAVLSTGGYAGFPAAFVAQRMGIPTVVHEANAQLGLAARWLATKAKRIGLSVPAPLPSAWQNKAKVVGLPVREEQHDPVSAKQALNLDAALPLVVVLGGSQGSLELNRELPARLKPLLGTYQVLHQCGPRWETEMQTQSSPLYHIRGFINTAQAFSAAEWVICRAGASTLAELAFYQVPALLVPLPANLDSGAQLANARFYTERGASAMLNGWERFNEGLQNLTQPLQRQALRTQLKLLSPAGAATRLAGLVMEVL